MPSPDYKNDIQNVTGSANITVCNKNLLNWNKIIAESENVNEQDGYIKFYQSEQRLLIQSVFKENMQYTIFVTAKKEVAGQVMLQVTYTDKTNEYLAINCEKANTDYSKVFTTKANKTIKVIKSTFSDNSISYLKIDETQLEEGLVSTPYSEHQEQNFTFPLAEGQRLMKGDYLADDGIHHARRQKVFDGSENLTKWNFESEEYIGFILNNEINYNNAIGNDIRAISNCFTVKSETNITEENMSLRQLGDGIKRVYICIKKNRLSSQDVAGFKAYLAEQKANGTPIILEYELAEEEIEPYTEEQQAVYDEIKKTAHSYGEQTHIFSTDETSPIFDVEAKAIVQNGTNGVDGKDGKNYYVEVVESTTTTQEIQANKFYKFGEVTELNITLAEITDNTQLNEYMFEFISGATATTLTLPDTIKWLETPTIEANKIYQCSIVDNIGILVGVANV